MKKAIIISIIFLLPTTSSAYSLLQPNSSEARLSRVSFLFAEEQPIEQPAEQPAPETIQEENSPDLGTEKVQKIYKKKNYWFPILWDLAPIPVFWLLANRCSSSDNSCFDSLVLPVVLSIPLWTIPSSLYASSSWLKTTGHAGGGIGFMLTALLIEDLLRSHLFVLCYDIDEEECESERNYRKSREGFTFWIGAISVAQTINILSHILFIRHNNDMFKTQQKDKQLAITPYIDKDRTGIALQITF